MARHDSAHRRHWLVPAWVLGIALALAAAGAAACWFSIVSFDRSTVALTNAHGMRIVAVIFTPRGPAPEARRPALIAIPPAATPPDATLAFTLEMVRRGAIVAVPDFPHSPRHISHFPEGNRLMNARTADVAAIVDYLKQRQDVDPGSIGLIGHSFGGIVAVRTGIQRPEVKAVVSVAGWDPARYSLPQNLMWLVGLFDEYYPLGQIQAKAQQSASVPLLVNHTVGEFPNGSARRLTVVPAADHFTEFWNVGTMAAAANWFADSFGREAISTRADAWLPAPWFYACYSLAFVFGWLLLYRAGLKLTSASQPEAGVQPATPRFLLDPAANRRRQYAFTAAAALLILFFVFIPLPKLSLFRADLALWGLALVLAVNARLSFRLTHWVLLTWLSAGLALLLLQAPYYWRYPEFLAGVAGFPFWFATGLLNQYLLAHARLAAFASFAGTVWPKWFFWVLLGAEVACPGIAIRGPWHLVKRLRGARPEEAAVHGRHWPGWLVILILFLVPATVLLLGERQRELDREALQIGAIVLLKYGVFPFAIFAVLERLIMRAPTRRAGGNQRER